MDEPVYATETHISQLFFTPDRVYKRLKPVDLGFVSFTDPQVRLAAAETEHQVNRRISPDVHLGTADVIEQGELVDRLIVMRRLPADRQLDTLVQQPAFERRIIEAARCIAILHSREEPVTGADAWMASGASLHANWADNFAALAPLAGTVIDEQELDDARSMAARYLRGRQALFAERIRAGRVRDGHGDLRAEHVFCLDDGPRLIDALAFSDDYRIGDVLNDVAFLAMDLHRLAGPAAATTLVKAYDEFTDEHHPATLAHHFVAYRAHVRAKVAAVRASQGHEEAAAEAAMYHRLAVEHLRVGQVRLVLVGGGAGVGKSTVAEGLARHLGATWLRTDEVRQGLTGSATDRPVVNPPGQGRYDPATTDAVYRELLNRATQLLQHGESVVLDGTWATTEHRALARQLARDVAAELTEVRCVAPLTVAKERIAERRTAMTDPSDATAEVAEYIDERFEPWPEATGVDTCSPIPDSIAAAAAAALDPGVDRSSEPGRSSPGRRVFVTHESIRFYLAARPTLPAAAEPVDWH